ncbi:MAG TPA: UDP-N-acetylmuramoyl-L-alanine--D-glutamate ligase [Opitutaceae bacterium]|nr:UDP-N-acetylmuramoyl-L-alanine--D-glutamate ligase [Opitutaceae bacterium]
MPLAVPPLLQPRLTRPVAILGGGVSGQAVRQLLAALGNNGTIYDEKGIEFTVTAARQHDLVIFSPGFPPEHPWFSIALQKGAMCLGELDFASLFWRGRVIAITGTNGKTTLTEFLTHALRSVGCQAVATGNIGHPFSQLVLDTQGGEPSITAVCEVSSFQAEMFSHFKADATLWPNFAEDHLDRHLGMRAYFDAKWTLVTRTASGRFFMGSSVRRFAAEFGYAIPPGAGVPTEQQAVDAGLNATVFADYPQRENFLIAAAWWRAAGLDGAALYAAARAFRVGRHRLSRVAELDGVAFWNDSKATNFHAVEAALNGFAVRVLLIAGGKAKGGNREAFISRIAGRVRHLFLIGETQEELATICSARGVAYTLCASLEEAVSKAAEMAGPGDHVLLSPGFASFDMFRNYEDRGDQFERIVRSLPATANLR